MLSPDEVLKTYINNCNQLTNFNEYIFASNGAFEWFGKTFQGSKRIYQHFRFNLCHQYEHVFETASICKPFEMTASHMKTMQDPPENSIVIKPIEIDPSNQLTPTTSQTKELSFDDDVSPNPMHSDLHTPTKQIGQSSTAIDDSLGCQALVDNSSDSDCDIKSLVTVNGSISTQRKIYRKRTNPSSFPSNGLEKRRRSFHEQMEIDQMNISPSTSTTSKLFNKINRNSNCMVPTTNIQYSPLQYIESIGQINTLLTPKHRGISSLTQRMMQMMKTNEQSVAAAAAATTTTTSHTRMAKLKISYRIRLSDGAIQFALIIYEHLARKLETRRNLMAAFDETIKSPTTTTTTTTVQGKSPVVGGSSDGGSGSNTKPKRKILKSMSSLKRLRF